MRLITYTTAGGPPRIGVRVGHRVLDIEAASRVNGEPLPGSMKALFREGRGALSRVQALAKAAQSNAGPFAGAMVEERAIRFLPPVPDPDKFVCVGENGTPGEVSGFVKLASSLVGHNAKVAKPDGILNLDYGPELVFVIGRRARGVTRDDDAMDYVVGVTLLNDLTDRDMRKREVDPDAPPWTIGPLGPEIVTMDEIGDPYDLWMTCSVNGEECMRVNTGDQIWKMPDILERFSRDAAIEPGDMFSIGAPGGVAAGKPNSLKAGDVVECSIEGITTLRTTIVAPTAPQ
jgi:2-keto-4-pentenoate hydratase/2-oxohepta-3-ene-1,7-dioic acid hydratase in catechol pathway